MTVHGNPTPTPTKRLRTASITSPFKDKTLSVLGIARFVFEESLSFLPRNGDGDGCFISFWVLHGLIRPMLAPQDATVAIPVER